MDKNRPPDLEMTLEGEFVSPPTPPASTRILLGAIVLAVIASAVAIAAVALWLALSLLPVALGAAAVAYGIYRYKLWRLRNAGTSQNGIWRP
jgi:Flp pilus assembly protein TadB